MVYDSVDYPRLVDSMKRPRRNSLRFDRKANIILSSEMYYRLMRMFPTMSFSAIVRYILDRYIKEFEKDGN